MNVLSVYTAIRCDDSGEIPDVRLFKNIQDAADWLLYPWREDGALEEDTILDINNELVAGRTVDMAQVADVGSTEQMVILNLVVL